MICMFGTNVGHFYMNAVINIIKSGAVNNIKVNVIIINIIDPFCDICKQGKQARRSHFSSDNKKASQPSELIYSDVCGPFSKPHRDAQDISSYSKMTT